MAEKKKHEEKAATESPKIKANATPDKIVPKFCTNVNFGVTQDKHVIISLIYQEGQPEEQGTLIERVITTYDHAKSIAKVFNELIERVEKNGVDNPK